MKELITRPNIGKRIGATIIDYGIIIAFFTVYVYSVGEPNDEGGYTVTGLPALVPVGFWFIYLIVLEYKWGSTLGHLIFRLSVTDLLHGNPSFSQILKRRICDIIDISMSFGIVALILVKNTKYNQRLGDIWAKTLVIDKEEKLDPRHHFEFEDDNLTHMFND
jgi:uncharacterized RDD family membrane protein YckC